MLPNKGSSDNFKRDLSKKDTLLEGMSVFNFLNFKKVRSMGALAMPSQRVRKTRLTRLGGIQNHEVLCGTEGGLILMLPETRVPRFFPESIYECDSEARMANRPISDKSVIKTKYF